MKIIVALPDNMYFLWQMLVQINNFRKLGYEDDLIYVIGKNTMRPSSILMNIMNSDIRASFYVINDTRRNPKYPSSLRPHILSKLFQKNPKMSEDAYFYIDPDVLFTKKIKFNDLLKNDIWYLSDTRSYINSKYIKSKSDSLFHEMCGVVGISPNLVEENDNSAGGAQYLMKNIDAEFWQDVEKDCEMLYQLMVATSTQYSPKNPIQAWTADMWAVLWNAWKRGFETKIIKRLNFSWATDPIKKWGENGIHHNAGAVADNDTLFVKTKYQKSPFNKKIKCSNKFCSYNYLKEVRDTEKNFSDIIF